MLASLNHPGIAGIYGLEEQDGTKALVLELVEGPTLADRIAQGPIPVDEALPIAKQIAEALEAAHEQGIIHRDLKPANIKLRPDGTVKVLDFGLAKALDATSGSASADPNQSPTLTAAATQMGVIMGTAAYMSPEQARGKPVDKRADIWAFGCVLFEMLTGRRAFQGADVSLTLAEVMKSDPDLAWLPADATPGLRGALTRCLTKDPRQRVRDISDVWLAMVGAFDGMGSAVVGTATGSYEATFLARAWRLAAPLAGLGLALGFGLGLWATHGRSPSSTTPTLRVSLSLPQEQRQTMITRASQPILAISPQGTHVAYAADDRLVLRAIDDRESTTVHSGISFAPFFSPDGEWLGFYDRTAQALKKVPILGGTPVTVANVPSVVGAHWAVDGNVYVGLGLDGIWRVPSNGGEAERLVEVEQFQRACCPQLLPDGETILYTIGPVTGAAALSPTPSVVSHSLTTGEQTTILGGFGGRYLPSGHLVYAVDGALLAVRFDVADLEAVGRPIALPEPAGGAGYAIPQFAISDTGSLVYVPPAFTSPTNELVWVDRTGVETPMFRNEDVSRRFRNPRLSPDGTQVAVAMSEAGQSGGWFLDLRRGALQRLDVPGDSSLPVFSPSGEHVVFTRRSETGFNLHRFRLDGNGGLERLTESERTQIPTTWSPDGSLLVFIQTDPANSNDIFVLPMDGSSEPRPFRATAADETQAMVSPNGEWIAYRSNTSGRNEVYIEPFPQGGAPQLVSTGGGAEPVWARDGRELFYRNGTEMMVVAVDARSGEITDAPAALFDAPYELTVLRYANYDVDLDGSRFVMIKPTVPAGSSVEIGLTFNWLTEID